MATQYETETSLVEYRASQLANQMVSQEADPTKWRIVYDSYVDGDFLQGQHPDRTVLAMVEDMGGLQTPLRTISFYEGLKEGRNRDLNRRESAI